MSEELILLKERATQMGIAYSPNIGLGALKTKIDAKLNPKVDEASPEVTPDEAPLAPVAKGVKAPAVERTHSEQIQDERNKQHKEQLALVRIRITNLNPIKKDLHGEIFTVANGMLGTIRKYVPYGEQSDNGYHVPFIIFNELKDRKFVSVKVRKVANGQDVVEQRLVPEFALEVLEPLTKEELSQLARQQAAAAGLD